MDSTKEQGEIYIVQEEQPQIPIASNQHECWGWRRWWLTPWDSSTQVSAHLQEIEGFWYHVKDVSQAVTKTAVKELSPWAAQGKSQGQHRQSRMKQTRQ
jgi:hypothetical protein